MLEAQLNTETKNRLRYVLQTVGIILLAVSVGLPLSMKLLHNLGFLEGWDGFGVFVIGMRVLPWGAGFGVLCILVGIPLKSKGECDS